MPQSRRSWRYKCRGGLRLRSDRSYGAVAFLVLFTTTAGTRIISPDFGLIAAHRFGLIRSAIAVAAARGARLGATARFDRAPRLSLGRRGRRRATAALSARRRRGRSSRFIALDLHVEELLADVAADAAHHLAEDHEAFLLVLLLRILLAVAAQTDALAQRLHRLEVLDPALVDLLQEKPPRPEQQARKLQFGLARLD